ncbi:MAG: ATP-binding protein [Saprospiraceae bacterium]|nr:GHKL domain-containing protein [Lewinella sp.]
MISLKLYHTILWFAGLMGLTSFGLVWSIYVTHSWLLALLLLLVLAVLIYALAHQLNATNRKIAFFVEAVVNEDTALVFPEVKDSPVMTAVHRGLNKLNTIIQKIKMENRAQEQYYQKIFDQINTGILTKDERGFIFLANRMCRQMTDRTQLTHIKQLAGSDPKLYRILKDIRVGERHLVNVKSQGEPLHLLLQATGFRTQDRDLTIITMQNIRNELDYKELDSWIKLISVLTHEISNTISPMTSLSESMYERFLEQEESPDNVQISKHAYQKTIEGLQVIKERGEGLIRFIDSYRRLTKLPRPEKKHLAVEDLIRKIKILVSGEPNFDQVSFRQQVIPEGLEVFADEKLLTQALINILKNAIEALQDQPNGIIRITARVEPNGKISIAITDNGPGIPPELLDDIFTPFFTTRASGSGIGLTLSRQILRLHGGTLSVKTVSERGVAFVMVL